MRQKTKKLPEPLDLPRRLAFGYFGSETNSLKWICPHGLINSTICKKCDSEAAKVTTPHNGLI